MEIFARIPYLSLTEITKCSIHFIGHPKTKEYNITVTLDWNIIIQQLLEETEKEDLVSRLALIKILNYFCAEVNRYW